MSQNREVLAHQEYAATMLSKLPFRTMSLQNRRLFYTLRLECWVNKQLPNNHSNLAKVLDLSVEDVTSSLSAVMPFFEAKGDFIICPELEDYRAHIAERKLKQNQDGKRGSAITNSKRKRAASTANTECSSTSTSTSTLPSISSSHMPTNPQAPCQGSDESLIELNTTEPNKAKPNQNHLLKRMVIDDSFVRDFEAKEQCSPDDYFKASRGY
jgi:uncharacterized protein YdaU (DUF1376 family)